MENITNENVLFETHVPQIVQTFFMEEIIWGGSWGTIEEIQHINSGRYYFEDDQLFGCWGKDIMIFDPEEGFSMLK